MQTIGERFTGRFGLDEADVATADLDGATFFDASELRRVAAVFGSKSLVNTKTLTGTLLQATSAAGAGAKVLGTAVVVTATATGAVQGIVEARTEEMDHENGFTYVGVRLGSNDATPAAGYAHLLLEAGRYLADA